MGKRPGQSTFALVRETGEVPLQGRGRRFEPVNAHRKASLLLGFLRFRCSDHNARDACRTRFARRASDADDAICVVRHGAAPPQYRSMWLREVGDSFGTLLTRPRAGPRHTIYHFRRRSGEELIS